MKKSTQDELARAVQRETEALLEAAAHDSIDHFQDILSRRDGLIQHIENESLTLLDSKETLATLVRTRELNEMLITKLNEEQRKLLDAKSKLKKGRQMKDAYGE